MKHNFINVFRVNPVSPDFLVKQAKMDYLGFPVLRENLGTASPALPAFLDLKVTLVFLADLVNAVPLVCLLPHQQLI